MDQKIIFYKLTYLSLMVLAIGAFTSNSISALSHILIIPPSLYFTFKRRASLKKIPLSQWALLGIIFVFIVSIFANANWSSDLWGSVLRVKYYLIPFLGIFAYQETFREYIDQKKIKILLHLFFISTSFASLAGLMEIWLGYNPVTQETQENIKLIGRASGLFRDINAYGYGLSLFMVFLTGLLIFREKIKDYISTKLLIIYWLINFMGLYFSYARGGWLGFFLAVPFFFLRQNLKIFFSFLAGIFLLLAILIQVDPTANDRFFNSGESNQERINFTKNVFSGFLKKPILGWGFISRDAEDKLQKDSYHAHNNFLEFLARAGIIGFTLLLVFHLTWGWESFRSSHFLGEISFVLVISLIITGSLNHTLNTIQTNIIIMSVYSLFCSIIFSNKILRKETLQKT